VQEVGEIMTRELITISPVDSIGRASALMEQFRIGGLPVLEGEKLVGILTSRDVRRSHPNRLVADAMTKKVITVHSCCSLWEAKEILEQYNIERLVVVDGGRHVGIITKSSLYAELGKHMDSLTGLKRADFLQRKASELLQQGKEIAVIFFDLDNFGEIDKKLGHVVGDAVLRKVAQVLKGVVDEEIDHLCRYAGDEFAVVTERFLEGAKRLAWDMVSSLERESWPKRLKVTASAGVAGGRRKTGRTSENGMYSVAELINMASLASTRAKKKGEKVVVAERVNLESVG